MNSDARQNTNSTSATYNPATGLPEDKTYLECGLPDYLQISLDKMKKTWKILDSGTRTNTWDLYWCELNADINSAEVDELITHEQADYLRRVYLRMVKE